MKIYFTKVFWQLATVFFLWAVAGQNLLATDSVSDLPPPAGHKINFDQDIQPILEENCLRCHGSEKPRGGFRLDNRVGALKGGENGVDIVPGNSTNSPLIHFVAYQVENMEMPPPGRGKQLTPEEISLLRAWIDQGVTWDATTLTNTVHGVFTLVGGATTVHGDKYKYRELSGQKNGKTGGLEQFQINNQIDTDTKWQLDGHLFPYDYEINFSEDKSGVGFIHSGWQQYRKYYDDTGGYDPALAQPPVKLDEDLHVDNGNAWIDFGLEPPRWPQIVAGYEYQYQNGNEAALDWGTVNGKNLYPATQSLNEQTHSLKLDITKIFDDWLLEDNARVDFYTEKNQGTEADILFGGPSPDQFITTRDNYRQVQGMDTLVLQKQLRDWWFINGGFYYSRLAGNDSFTQTTAIPLFSSVSILSSDKITLERESEIFSMANLFSPLDGLTLSLGTQNEWTRESGFGDSIPDLELGGAVQVPANSSLSEFKASQNANVRFSKIPFTIISGDAQLSEDDYEIDQAEDTDALQRETAANNFRYDLKTGFSTSPWEWGDLTVQYERQSSRTDYNQLQDIFVGAFGEIPPPTNGYPAFILGRIITSDEFEAKLALQPVRWLKVTLTYQISMTDYSSKTDPAYDPILATLVSEGGTIAYGRYDLQTYGIGTTLTPFRRLYLSGQFTYSHSRVTTANNGDPSIAPYDGDIFTFNGTTTYALTADSSLQMAYNLSQADYLQNNGVAGIPTGLDYLRQDLMVGVAKQLNENVSAALRYEFSQYNEPSSGGATNYRANSLFATLTCRF